MKKKTKTKNPCFSIYNYVIIKCQKLQLNNKTFLHLVEILRSMFGYFSIKEQLEIYFVKVTVFCYSAAMLITGKIIRNLRKKIRLIWLYTSLIELT